MKKITSLALVLFAFVGNAYAQTAPGSITLTWTNPTTGCSQGVTPCDNKPLTGADALTGVDVFLVAAASPPAAPPATPFVSLSATTTTTTQSLPVRSGDTIYAWVRANNAAFKGMMSNRVASGVVTFPVVPGVPSGVTIQLNLP